ncbi:glycosyltransferase [Vibrio vulnificus]|nr:glycosyltransferase [Vibrio vulnificus]
MNNLMNIVVVNFNNSQCTLDLIDSLHSNREFINEVIVVDNSSTLSEVDLLKSIQSNLNVKIILLDENIGYFHGLNHGINFLESKMKHPTFIGNNDLIFSDDFFRIFFDFDYGKKTLAIAPCFITSDGVYQNPAQPSKPSRFKRLFYSLYFSNYLFGNVLYKCWRFLGLSAQSMVEKDCVSRPIYLGMGAGYILLPRFFYKYDKLNYPNFLYGEEAFFSKQIEDAQGELFYHSDLNILHLESVATKKIPTKRKYELMKKSYLTYKEYFRG